jgi:hypothetical protein
MTNQQILPIDTAADSRETLKSWICELTTFQPEQVDSLLERMEENQAADAELPQG